MRLYGHIVGMNEERILNCVLNMKVKGKIPRQVRKDVTQKEGRIREATEELWEDR
jgi:hypothetical protein